MKYTLFCAIAKIGHCKRQDIIDTYKINLNFMEKLFGLINDELTHLTILFDM